MTSQTASILTKSAMLLLVDLLLGCTGGSNSGTSSDSDVDSDTDSDTNTDFQVDSDSDAGTDTNSDSDVDSDTYGNIDTVPENVDTEYADVSLTSEINRVQPMTGIVMWNSGGDGDHQEIQLEYSYMGFDEVAVAQDSADWDWSGVESLLDDIASHRHQAILRFYYVYPGDSTTVPGYIKDMEDYEEISGITEGKDTWFPDWSHDELKAFTEVFYTEFASRYDTDPRIAFLQVGFGLWGEYHIYEPGENPGVNFPDLAYQKEFVEHLDTVFQTLHWSISIDAASSFYAPFRDNSSLTEIPFGLFDDSFLHANHDEYNKDCFEFFGEARRMTSPVGGEFSYYSNYDQQNVLSLPDGPHGISFEALAARYNVTYMIGNDQPKYQSWDRIQEAGMATGYHFEIRSFRVSSNHALVTVANTGIAPIYYDAYVAVNDVRSKSTLKGLAPGQELPVEVYAGGSYPELTIECERLVDGQSIQYDANL